MNDDNVIVKPIKNENRIKVFVLLATLILIIIGIVLSTIILTK